MIPFSLSKIAQVLNAEWIGQDRVIYTIAINSTQITEKCLFIALLGERFDGHCFINQAVAKGAYALLVNRYFILDVPQLIVKDTYFALAQLGAWVRRQVSAKVIAITGSSGKTSVKEMTTSILKNIGQVVATKENYNNKFGVPLTLLRLTHEDNFAVIEIGASNFGEISWISSLVCPDVVLVNNIFSAHLLGFGSLLGVAEAKGEIFSSLSINGVCIINADNNAWLLWKRVLSFRSVLIFSIQKKDGIDFFASNIVCDLYNTQFILNIPYGCAPVRLSMLGYHNVSNALAASALSFSVGATLEAMVLGLEKICPLVGRLFPIFLSRGKLLLDDSYNSNIGSILASVRVLERIYGYRVVVLGDVSDLGDFIGISYHCKIGKFLEMTNVNKILSIGNFSYYITYISERGEHFYNKNTLIIRIIELLHKYEVITVLIKGSRSMLMDQLVVELQGQIL